MDAAEFESILRAAQGEAEWAWSRLYGWLAADIRGYLRARGAESPDDVLGEVFVQIARNIATFEGSAPQFRSWAFMVAHHRLIDEFRHRNADRSQRHRIASRVSYRLRLLRQHGLIRKVKNQRRYHVTPKGRKIISAVLAAQHATLQQLNAIAA